MTINLKTAKSKSGREFSGKHLQVGENREAGAELVRCTKTDVHGYDTLSQLLVAKEQRDMGRKGKKMPSAYAYG